MVASLSLLASSPSFPSINIMDASSCEEQHSCRRKAHYYNTASITDGRFLTAWWSLANTHTHTHCCYPSCRHSHTTTPGMMSSSPLSPDAKWPWRQWGWWHLTIMAGLHNVEPQSPCLYVNKIYNTQYFLLHLCVIISCSTQRDI